MTIRESSTMPDSQSLATISTRYQDRQSNVADQRAQCGPAVACRDLANGCYIAELLARHFPGDVPLHSFENVTSVQLKDANWYLLRRILQAHPPPRPRPHSGFTSLQ